MSIPRNLASRVKRSLVQYRWRYLSRRSWRARHRKVYRNNPAYRAPCDRELEREHLRFWRQLRRDVDVDTLRVCANISGHSDVRIVPEEVFESEIEPRLNPYPMSRFLENKNIYRRWFSRDVLPEALLHNIDGEFLGAGYDRLDRDQVRRLIDGMEFPVVIKPSIFGGGGRDVAFPRSADELGEMMRERSNFVVEKVIRQHPFYDRFRAPRQPGLNTFRVCVYRSVTDNEMHILTIALRMGRGGTLDNETAGGVVCYVHDGGRLNDYAVDKYGTKFPAHPDTGLVFAEQEAIPDVQGLRTFCLEMAREIYLTRLVSLDVCMDFAGRWRMIEVNLAPQTIRFAQYAGQPFFGRLTQEVVDYCKQTPAP